MADGDAAAIHVVLLVVDAELVATVNALRGKGFVQLPQVHIILLDADVFQQARNGEHGADAHFVRLASRHREAAVDAHRLNAELGGAVRAHQQRHRRAIGQLRGVAGGDRAIFLKGRRQPGETFQGGGRAVALVPIHRDVHAALRAGFLVHLEHGGGHRRDFLRHPTRFLGPRVALLALQGVHVLHFARHLVAAGDHFGGVAHGHEDVWLFLDEALVRIGLAGGLPVAHGDGIHPAGHRHLGVAGSDLVGGDGDGLQAGGAETVDREARRGDGQARQHHRQPRQVAVLLAGVVGGADDDVFHFVRGDVRIPIQERVNEMRQHVIGSRQVEAAAEGLGQSSPHTVHHYDVSHDSLPPILV